MEGRQQFCVLVTFGAFMLAGCAAPHGQPLSSSEVLAPNQIQDFATLYSDNCAGCHGESGRGGAAIALADPVYLAISDEEVMRKVISAGVKGTSMPAFAESAGGLLSDQQIDIISQQMRLRWSKPGILDGANPPSYAAKSAGDSQRGAIVYQTFCQSCHGVDGRGGPKGSSITDDSFLALISDQELRTIVIAGRPELGAPDWRGDSPGKPMSDQDVTDVVAWLASRRSEFPGQPYSASNYGSH